MDKLPTQSKFKYQVEKIASAPGEGVEVGVFTKVLTLPEDGEGLLAACILTSGAGDLGQANHDVFDVAVKEMGKEEEGVLERMGRIGEAVSKYSPDGKVEVDYQLAFFYKGVCYLDRRGEKVQVVVFSDGAVRELSIRNGSGPVASGQVYLIATKTCLELFDFSVLNDEETDLSEVIDGMATELSAQKQTGDIGAVFVRVAPEDSSTDSVEDAKEEAEAAPSDHVVEAEVTENEVTVGDDEVAVTSEKEHVVIAEEAPVPIAVQAPGVGEEQLVPRENFLGAIFGKFGMAGKRLMAEVRGVAKGDNRAIGSARRKVVILGILVCVILAFSVGVAVWQKQKAQHVAEFKQHLSLAKEKYSEGTAIIELNRARAKKTLIEAQNEVKLALALDSKNADATKLSSDIEAGLKATETGGETKFTEVATVGSGIKAIAISNKNLVVTTGEKVSQVDTSGKVTGAIESLKNVTTAAVFDGRVFYLQEDGVWRQELAGGKAVNVADIKAALDIGVFFGNVYLLKSDQIAKIVPIEGGYAKPTDYLDSKKDFKSSSRMAIDSLIWVTSGDKILKFNRGKQESFEINGITAKVGELSLIYTDGTLDNLYVVDSANSAILVIGKDGTYKKSLQSDELSHATDLVVNDSEDTIYVAVGSKVIKASLK